MADRKTQTLLPRLTILALPCRSSLLRYPGGDPENGPAEPHYVDTGLPVWWEEDFAKVEGTAAGVLMLMERHRISIADIIDAVIERDNIIGVGLITVKDQLIEIVDKHLK